jgi:hypothetical protein
MGRISMDFIEGLPMSEGKDKIFVVDKLTNPKNIQNSKKHPTNF